MIASPRVRAARKEMQLKRLAAKEDDPEGYPEFYANQPFELVKAARQEEVRVARTGLVEANEDLQIAEITGEGLAAAQEAAAIAALVVEKLTAPAPKLGAALSAAPAAA